MTTTMPRPPLFVFATLCMGTRVWGHGLLTVPSTKNGGTVSTPTEGTSVHYALASFGIIDKAFFDGDHGETPWTRPGEFDHELARDLIDGHPITLHPCGCNAAGLAHCAGVGPARGFGETTQGDTITPAVWPRGSAQDVAWNAWVNHAGGQIYMLCKKSTFDACRDDILPDPVHAATQAQQDQYLTCVWDCFESNYLEWDESGNWTQKLQFKDYPCTYATMEPMTKPGKDGHLWRFTPIPDSLQVTNGGEGRCTWDSLISFSNNQAKTEFEASFGSSDVCDAGPDHHAPADWHVFDKVKVPLDLAEGEYLLSWRWDGYKADQMWTNCADVTIAPPEDAAAPAAAEDCGAPLPGAPSPGPPGSGPAPDDPPEGPYCPSGFTGLRPTEDCTHYFRCLNGQAQDESLDCPPGTLFDVEAQYCNWSDQVTCAAQAGGCYSNNWKDCNLPDMQQDDASCDTIWLPDGARNACVALWGSCTNAGHANDHPGLVCCEPAVCQHAGDGGYAQCVPS